MDRIFARDFGEDPGNLSEADIVGHDLKVNSCRLGWVVKDPEVVDSDVAESYQWYSHITRFNNSQLGIPELNSKEGNSEKKKKKRKKKEVGKTHGLDWPT